MTIIAARISRASRTTSPAGARSGSTSAACSGRSASIWKSSASDDEHVGTVDKTAGDRIILTKSDPDSGGAHHSLSCSEIDRVEGDKVILDCSADEARNRWRDESRSRALFEREDQGEMGPRILNRSFEGTYR